MTEKAPAPDPDPKPNPPAPAPPAAGVGAAPPAASGDMVPKARLDEALGELNELAASLLAEVPEKLRGLVPEELSPSGKVKWLKKAKEAGLFGNPEVPPTDSGKPPVTPKGADLSKLPPTAKLAAGYGKGS